MRIDEIISVPKRKNGTAIQLMLRCLKVYYLTMKIQFFLLLEEQRASRMDKSFMNSLASHILQLGTYFFEKHVSPFVEDLSTIRNTQGGLRGPDDQIQSCHSETSYPTMPKICDFLNL